MTPLTLSIIQPELIWEDKTQNLRMLEEKINTLPFTELVILPEMFSTGFSMRPEALAEKMDGPALQWMQRIAAEKKIILTGSLIIEEGGKYFNRLVWMLPNKQYGYYDKRHLFAFAGEHQHYTAGNRRLIASVKGWKINLQVCFDLRFPVWARQQPTAENGSDNGPEYDILVYVANWPETRAHAWKTLLEARAIENQCYVIGVNRVGRDGNDIYHSGDSMIVDPMGDTLIRSANDEFVYTTTLNKSRLEEVRGKLPFLKAADPFRLL